MFRIENLTKVYENGKVGADNVNLHVQAGDIFAFIGHNGAGKTTTMKCAVGILEITSGNVFLDGISIKDNPVEFKKHVAYIPDSPNIYQTLTGIQYINFIADIYGVDKNERSQLTKKYSEMLGLAELNAPISTYSHGMKQKLVIISALVHKPKLLILDEPFVGLDPKASFTLKNIMHEFVKSGGAIFFSTHILEVAEKLCNKVAIIKDSKIIANGTMAEIRKDASLEEVFLESSNDKHENDRHENDKYENREGNNEGVVEKEKPNKKASEVVFEKEQFNNKTDNKALLENKKGSNADSEKALSEQELANEMLAEKSGGVVKKAKKDNKKTNNKSNGIDKNNSDENFSHKESADE